MKLKIRVLLCMLISLFASKVFAYDAFLQYEPKPHEQIFNQEMYQINAIDPTVVSNIRASAYPGLRGLNQLIIYTPEFGRSTGTNEFGAEAVVVGNVVTSISGADTLIPEDGLVISVHGNAKKWFNENIFVGSKIYIDKATMTLTTYVTSDSFVIGAEEKINEANSIISYYENNYIDYDGEEAKSSLNKAKRYLRRAKYSPKNAQKYASSAVSYANHALATAVPYKDSELKGVWIRPIETSPASIIETLDRLKESGIDNIFLETYYHGKTIFPSITMSKYGFTKQNDLFVGFDPLKVWVTEAHKRNIKVNIWFESFYVGNKPPLRDATSILAVKPYWSNINRKNINATSPVYSVSEHNGYFLDPANPEVTTFLIELLREIILNYKPDGINLDYTRYPQSVVAKYSNYEASNWGYTQYARTEFKGLYGEDPANIEHPSAMWTTWDNYRRNKLTEYVRQVSYLCQVNNVFLSAVVFPNKKSALETKQQDWPTWSKSGYIKAYTPLFLTCDAKTIKSMILDFRKELAQSSQVYAGLFVTFMGGNEEDLIKQIHETRKQNLGGVIIFDYAHLDDKYLKILMKSAFLKLNDPYNIPKSIKNNRENGDVQ